MKIQFCALLFIFLFNLNFPVKILYAKTEEPNISMKEKPSEDKDSGEKGTIRFQGEIPIEMLEDPILRSIFLKYYKNKFNKEKKTKKQKGSDKDNIQQFLTELEKEKIIDDFEKNYEDVEKTWVINKYENLISGSVAMVFGTVGFYFIANEQNMFEKMSYSLVQSFGIISFGVGTYNLLTPTIFEKYLNILENLKNTKEENTIFLASEIMRYYAEKSRSQRITTSVTTAALTLAYLTSALTSLANPSLSKIYYFLSGINLLIATGSYFMETKYERIYKDFQKSGLLNRLQSSYDIEVQPIVGFSEGNVFSGAGLRLRF